MSKSDVVSDRLENFIVMPEGVDNFVRWLATIQNTDQPCTQAVVEETAWQLTWIQIVHRHDVKEITDAPVQAMIMHVIFDHSHMAVRNVQARFCCQQDLSQAYIRWLLSYLSSVDTALGIDLLSLTDVNMPD